MIAKNRTKDMNETQRKTRRKKNTSKLTMEMLSHTKGYKFHIHNAQAKSG